jgi:hypothetical protein
MAAREVVLAIKTPEELEQWVQEKANTLLGPCVLALYHVLCRMEPNANGV